MMLHVPPYFTLCHGVLGCRVAVLQAAAMACDPDAVPVASDDVDGVQWVEVAKLRQLQSECCGV